MVSILTLDGERLARWGGPIHRSCHGIWVDSHSDLYVVQPGEWWERWEREALHTGPRPHPVRMRALRRYASSQRSISKIGCDWESREWPISSSGRTIALLQL